MESSYILYREQFNEIQAIYRYYDELSEENKEKRKETIRQTLHPTLFQKHSRDLKNFANTFRDALMQAIGVAIGQMKKSHPGSMILKAHEQEISDMSKEFIGYVGTAFDPILERHIGRKVVLEIAKNGKITEYPGVLREYSANFLEVLNVKKAMQNTFTIRLDEEKKIPGKIRVTFTEGQIAIENKGENPVFIKEVQTAEKVHELNVVAQPETIADFPLDVPAKEVCIVVEIAKDMDIVVPRVHALIRHSSETKTPKIELEILRKLPVKK